MESFSNPSENLNTIVGKQKKINKSEPVIIDIALGNKKHRVTLIPGTDPKVLAAEFAKDHKLSVALQQKLLESLLAHL